MGFGALPSAEDARPQMFSPRHMPQKRPVDLGGVLDEAKLDSPTPRKIAKVDSDPPSVSTAAGPSSPTSASAEEVSSPVLDAAKLDSPTTRKIAKVDSDPPSVSTAVGPSSPTSEEVSSPVGPSSPSAEEVSSPVVCEMLATTESVSSPQEEHIRFDRAVAAAMHVFRETWIAFAIERDAGNLTDEKNEDHASKVCELLVAERYESMRPALLDLLPWLGPVQLNEQGSDYKVVEFQGQKPPWRLEKQADDSDECLYKLQLEWLRTEPRGRAWEALGAAMAAVSTRKEKCWLEAHETTSKMNAHIQTLPGCKSKKSARRKGAIRTFLEKNSSSGCGFFSSYLLDPTTNLRFAFTPGEPRPTPASLVITARMPLWDALASLDDGGPIRGKAASREWCLKAGRQFAFQAVNFGVEETREKAHEMRVDAETLEPDSKLRDLLKSKKPVVLLEVVAALAPREMAKKQGLGQVVKAELKRVMHEAKRRGEAVVFCLGSDKPHALAEKVYVRAPISDHGLRCGYLRWRASADAPWAREREFSERICLCLQMP